MPRLRCRKYAVITAYLRMEAAWTRTLREVAEAGGDIVVKDEMTRRIVVNVSKTRIAKILEILLPRSIGVAVEVKAACKPARLVDLGKLREAGFLAVGGRAGRVYYGVLEGRLVMVEKARGSIIVKVGARAGSRPKSVPPASAFILKPDDAQGALEALDMIVAWLKG